MLEISISRLEDFEKVYQQISENLLKFSKISSMNLEPVFV